MAMRWLCVNKYFRLLYKRLKRDHMSWNWKSFVIVYLLRNFFYIILIANKKERSFWNPKQKVRLSNHWNYFFLLRKVAILLNSARSLKVFHQAAKIDLPFYFQSFLRVTKQDSKHILCVGEWKERAGHYRSNMQV